MIHVLEPFKVADSDTTSITKNIRQELDTLSQEDFFSLNGCWSIGCLYNQLTFESVGVTGMDGFFYSSWDEKVTKLMM
jgi:hypothetical protein